jgi:hypothetical protein
MQPVTSTPESAGSSGPPLDVAELSPPGKGAAEDIAGDPISVLPAADPAALYNQAFGLLRSSDWDGAQATNTRARSCVATTAARQSPLRMPKDIRPLTLRGGPGSFAAPISAWTSEASVPWRMTVILLPTRIRRATTSMVFSPGI